MRVAFPVLGGRISPRCSIAKELLLLSVEGPELRHREARPLRLTDEQDLVERMIELSVSLLVCGGIGRELVRDLEANGVAVMNNVAGETEDVVQALLAGTLAPGYGLQAPSPTVEAPPARFEALFPDLDCTACPDPACRRGASCPREVPPAALPRLSFAEERIAEVGRDVAAEKDPHLCRIAELVHFGLAMGYRRIGLAFCQELFHEVEILVPVLRRFFAVVPVCCRIGSSGNGRDPYGDPHRCNPVLQARILEGAGTELNVVAGLCMGCDVIFNARSRAPVTTLFVKDRSLAHNPIGAIYTRYHLEGLATTPRESGEGLE